MVACELSTDRHHAGGSARCVAAVGVPLVGRAPGRAP